MDKAVEAVTGLPWSAVSQVTEAIQTVYHPSTTNEQRAKATKVRGLRTRIPKSELLTGGAVAVPVAARRVCCVGAAGGVLAAGEARAGHE